MGPRHMLRHLSFALMAALGLLVSAPGQAAPITYTITLSGANEVPVNGSPGIGSGTIIVNTTLNTLDISMSFSGLTGNTTAAHIHCCTSVPGVGTAGVATTTPSFVGFPLGVTSGTFTTSLNMTLASSYNAAFVTSHGGTTASAEAALAAALANGTAYFNIHTSTFAGGEIRSFTTLATAAPEPATLSLLLAGVAGIAYRRRRR